MDIYIIENNMKRKMKDERKSSKKISDGSDVRSSWNYSSNGFSYYSKCKQYFSAHAHSGVNLRAFVWMAIWVDLWIFNTCFVKSFYRNATGSNFTGNGL